MEMNLPLVQEAAVQFVIRLSPEDKGVVGFFNSKIQFSPGLTNDRDNLTSYIRNNMQRGNSTRLWDATDGAMEQLADVTGRRVVVALTDGGDFGSNVRRARLFTAGTGRQDAQDRSALDQARPQSPRPRDLRREVGGPVPISRRQFISSSALGAGALAAGCAAATCSSC